MAIVPEETEAWETNVIDVCGTWVCAEENDGLVDLGSRDMGFVRTANIGRMIIGSTVGMDAFGSPFLET